ncbi:MAG: adenosylcobinamide-phosphate synthase CbiB [Clostridia bacterium]|nr:adenosylcobinamide-phosphate synthase CbiB [Clostridia bacterium]
MILLALVIGFILDILLGDPPKLPHLVIGIGKAISAMEKGLRGFFPKTSQGEFGAGLIMAILLPVAAFGLTWLLLYLCGLMGLWLRLILESLLCWKCLATRSLGRAGMKVYEALITGNLAAARLAVGQIVGRDTATLDASGISRATVETVSENTSDGVIAPMLFMAVGGAPFAVFYKAINTMDSMVGYKNERYLYFGKAAARLDDIANFVPARLAGLLIVLSAYFAKLDLRKAWHIFLRDRYNHKSPNSAQTEAACAGALHVQLGGASSYFGKLVHKPTLGDDDRPIEPKDILRANSLLYWSSGLCLFLCIFVKGAILWL